MDSYFADYAAARIASLISALEEAKKGLERIAAHDDQCVAPCGWPEEWAREALNRIKELTKGEK
jgi:hypothetical protein